VVIFQNCIYGNKLVYKVFFLSQQGG
jgi:hypothetical protein